MGSFGVVMEHIKTQGISMPKLGLGTFRAVGIRFGELLKLLPRLIH